MDRRREEEAVTTPLSDREAEITRILTTWPEGDQLAGVLRVVRAMQEDIDAERRSQEACEDVADRERENRKAADRERDAHRQHAIEMERERDAERGVSHAAPSTPPSSSPEPHHRCSLKHGDLWCASCEDLRALERWARATERAAMDEHGDLRSLALDAASCLREAQSILGLDVPGDARHQYGMKYGNMAARLEEVAK